MLSRRRFIQVGTAIAATSSLLLPTIMREAKGCQLLIRTVNGGNWRHPMAGDILNVVAGNPVRGRCEDFDQWVSEGRDPEKWEGGFQLVYLPNVSPHEVNHYTTPGDKAYRMWKTELHVLKQMAVPLIGVHKLVIDVDHRLLRTAALSAKPWVKPEQFIAASSKRRVLA